MAAPSWIILSTTARVSDTPLPDDLALTLKVEAPPRVSFVTLAPSVSRNDEYIYAFDPSGLLVIRTGDTYSVLDVPAAKVSYRLPEDPPTCFDEYGNLGVIAYPAGATGAFVLADFQFTFADGGGDEEKTLVRYWSRTRKWRTELNCSPEQDEHEVPDKCWEFSDVVSHDGDIWWIDTDYGLVACNALRDRPPFRYVPLPAVDYGKEHLGPVFRHKFERGLVGRRYVQLSDGKFRCVHIRKPKGHSVGAAPTFITMRTLIDPETGDWTGPEYKLTFADIRASETFKAAGLPENKDPVFVLIHPKIPDVMYFVLDDYIFAFDMRARKLIECEAHGLGTDFEGVRAWELSPDYAAAIAPAASRH